jgi:hypothetical protein
VKKKMMRQFCLALFVLVAAAATAAPTFLSVWKSPEVSRLNFAGKKVAALVITDDQPLQQSAEEALTRELTARGVTALPSYRIVPREEIKSAEKARGWFERQTVEGVVALRPVSREKEKTYSSVVWSSGYYPSFWGYYGYGWSNLYVAPVSSRTDTVIVVETLIYDVTRDRLVWAATSETRNPKTLQSFITELVAAAVSEMKKMKLVS